MLRETLTELKEEAKRLGVPWSHVCQLKSELVEHERQERETPEGVRRRAWQLYVAYNGWSPGCLPFWRCGWDHVRRRLENSDRDYTAIARYDEIAATIGVEFPEWEERDAGELYEFLFEPFEPWPERLSFYDEALAWFEDRRSRTADRIESDW